MPMKRKVRITQSPDKRYRQKVKHKIQDLNPEAALEYFQISVNVLEARKLAWANPHSANSYVVVTLGKEKHRTRITKDAGDPCYREYFLFEWYASVCEVQHASVCLSVMEPKCCAPPRLLGETNINLATVWEQPNHQVFHKWAQLSLPREPEAGAVGFLKVDVSIICRGDEAQDVIAIVDHDRAEVTISPGLPDSEQQTANYLITIYGAFGLPPGPQSQGDRRYVKPPSTYVKVYFSGLSGKTAVQYRSFNPAYCEQISIVETFPNICQLIRLEVCSADACFNQLIASVDMRLALFSHDGERGFVPTFGPSLLHMYGNVSSGYGASGESGPYHKGALLVALKTVVPYCQQGLRSTNVEPVTPLQMDDLWVWETFTIYCPIFEVSMLDKRFVGTVSGVALTVGEIPCEYEADKDFVMMTNEIKSRKLHYTEPLDVTMNSSGYGYLNFSAFPVLQLATCLPDFRFRVFANNMVRMIASDLEITLNAVEKKFTNYVECSVYSDLVVELCDAMDNAASSMRKFLDIEDFTDQRLDSNNDYRKCFETELDHRQYTLQKEEINKIYQQITKKIRSNSTFNALNVGRKKSSESYTVTKKEVKSLLADANILKQKISNLVFASPEGWPDIVVWLLSGVSRVAYYKMSLADIVYSETTDQCGKYCGRIQTIYLKTLKCSKHLNTLPSSCTCIVGKIEIVAWMGLFHQKDVFSLCLPDEYKLKIKSFDLCLKTSLMMLQCRVFINRAKFYIGSESACLPSTFVRVHALNCVIETKVESNTVTPSWNVVLKIQNMVLISQSRLIACPPTALIEVFDNEATGKVELIGRLEIQPVVDDRLNYQCAPKLQWYDILRGVEKTGQILMSVQLLQVPESLVKSTVYTVDETTNEYDQKEVVPEDLIMERLPLCLMPKLCLYKLDIYWWGLRDVIPSRKPCAYLEIDDLNIKSDIITEGKTNCNFPSGRVSQKFEAPLNEAYCPPLMIKLCDSSTFGRTLFMGTNVVKNPNKYMVQWLPENTREASLKSVSIMSSNFLRVSDSCYVMKNTCSEESTEYSKVTISSSFLETRKTKQAWKKIFHKKEPDVIGSNAFFQSSKVKPVWKSLFCTPEPDEEEFVLLPVNSKGKENLNLAKNISIPVPEQQDWWLRFFESQKGRTLDNNNKFGKIKIYNSELESQPEFSKFKDWCKTLKLYRSKKTGIAEKDVKLQCGFMKVGIAIYNWPPPTDTVAVNSYGVNLMRGYFDDLPVNDAAKFLVRVYIVKGLNLIARSFTGQSDPYVVISCGSKHTEDNNHYVTNNLNPVFGKMYEFQCCLPEDYLLTVSIYDHEALSPDDLIGSTTIDLEDRIYSKHRARVGLATDYKVTGPAKWRDCLKPSAILEEVCAKNHISPPIFLDNNTVIVNDVQYKDTDQTNKTYISASERIENICLELLHKWQTLPLCGYQMVPEHVETRSLFNPDKPGSEQGKIQMWVDIFPLDTGKYIPLPVDIAPRKVEDYELRLTVWSVQGLRSVIQGENKRRDIYVKAWIGCVEQAQYTDIHYQSFYDEGIFNWRMIFHFQYQHAEKTMILKEKGPFTEVEEHLPPMLIVQVIDSDSVSNDGCLGTVSLDLNSIPRGSKLAKECKLSTMDNSKRVNLFTMRSIRGWWSLKCVDMNTGTTKFAGVIDMEMSLIPKEMAFIMPVGLGRDPPFPLPEPSRPESYNGMSKSSFLETIFQSGGSEYMVIGIILILTCAAAFYWEFPNILIGSLLR